VPTGKRVVVGSKDFTESVILAEILAQMLERQGVEVERQLELGGNLPHESLLSRNRSTSIRNTPAPRTQRS
jgi:glycine betaine/choline ABC-type transport system substrate-binding protein